MRVQRWIGLGVVIALGALVCQAARAEGGRPSRQMLEQMGLGSLVVMSDDEAQTVRGQGYPGGSHVRVTGNSWATIGGPNAGAHSENAYFAEGKHVAKGSNSSYAGVVHIWSGHNGHGGDWGQQNPRSNYGQMPGGGYPGGGHPGGGWGGKPTIHTTVFFAGGHSSAWAF